MPKEPTLHYRDANLNDPPQPIQHNRDTTHIAIGDLHGNVMKLIYFFIEESVMQLKDKHHYGQLKTIYDKSLDDLVREDINLFELILKEAKFDKKYALTLIGDDLADRGQNDYFTLLVINRLFEENIEVEILLSNHSVEFIRDYERDKFTGQYGLCSSQCLSLENMVELIKKGWVNENKIRKIVKDCYAPMVKGIGYTLSENGAMTLFTHAPVGLETVKALALHYGIQYSDISQRALIHTIDAINLKISTQFGKDLASTIDGQRVSNPFRIPVANALYRLVWNRALRDELKTKPAGQFKVYFVHGHIGPHAIRKNGRTPLAMFENMDNYFGKNAVDESTFYYDVEHFTRHSSDILTNQLNAEFFETLERVQVKPAPTYSKINLFLSRKNNSVQASTRFATHIDAAFADCNPLTQLKRQPHSSYQRTKLIGGVFILVGLMIAFDPQFTLTSTFSSSITFFGMSIAAVGIKMIVSARKSAQESRVKLSSDFSISNDCGKQVLTNNHLGVNENRLIRFHPIAQIPQGAAFVEEHEEKEDAFDLKQEELPYK